jgi:hypothetical protein
MIERPIVKPDPPPAHREVVKVVHRQNGDEWQHPSDSRRSIEHIWRPSGYYSRSDPGLWEWMPNGANPQWTCSGYPGSWNHIVYFSDGTLGVIEEYQVTVALAALNVRLLSSTTT